MTEAVGWTKQNQTSWRGKKKKAWAKEDPASPDAWFVICRVPLEGEEEVARVQGKEQAIDATIRLAEQNPGITCRYRLEVK